MQSEQIINILHIGFIICLVLTILFAALSVFFFFQFKIRDVFNAITGRAQRKSVQQMEEENAKDENFDAASISAVKTSLMGPMAGIGDAFFWGTLLTIAIGVSVSFAKQGSIIGPIAFLLIINIPGFLARYYCLHAGFKYGVKFFGDSENSRMIENITKAASILGLMVIGAMIASTVSISIPFEIGVKGAKEPIQTYIDQIMPCLLPLTAFGIMYWLLGKNVKTTTILVCLIILACIGTFFGLL